MLEIRAVLDVHDALVRDCVEGRLGFGEFLAAYGDFPREYASVKPANAEESEVLRLFRKRLEFHKQVAGAMSGLRATVTVGSLEDSGVGDYLPVVGLMRLRKLLERHPTFEATG
jgi:hypothetical protein